MAAARTSAAASSSRARRRPEIVPLVPYKDLTAIGAYEIKWDESIATSEDRCVKLKVNQPMSWVGQLHDASAEGVRRQHAERVFDTVKDNLSGREDGVA